MGAVLTQRPEIARAVVAAVPVMDSLRSETTTNGRYNTTEYGTVEDAHDFAALLAYSPYHNVVDETRYPAVLLTAGENDTRVDAWHAKKMTEAPGGDHFGPARAAPTGVHGAPDGVARPDHRGDHRLVRLPLRPAGPWWRPTGSAAQPTARAWARRGFDLGPDRRVSTAPRVRSCQSGPDMLARMSLDPVVCNPEHYKVVLENERVRVLEYSDQPGDRTTPHQHPDSVMYTLSTFKRLLVSGEVRREVELEAGSVGWLPAQVHHGENIGNTPSHVLFVELKESAGPPAAGGGGIGPRPS